MVKSMSLVA